MHSLGGRTLRVFTLADSFAGERASSCFVVSNVDESITESDTAHQNGGTRALSRSQKYNSPRARFTLYQPRRLSGVKEGMSNWMVKASCSCSTDMGVRMLTEDDLLIWYRKRRLSESARTLINTIRSSEPVRRVGGGAANVIGRYPSKKMGRVIQFESHRVEFAFVLEFEHDASVLEYYDQPCRVWLQYAGRTGRRVTARHTPDYFVLRADTAGWEECKTVSMAAKNWAKMAAKWPMSAVFPFPLDGMLCLERARSCQGRAVVGRGEANP